MKNKTLQKGTLEMLLNRKMQAENDRMSFKDIDIPELGISLPFQKLPITSVLDVMEGASKDVSINENYEKCVQLIYESCPMLRDKKVLEGCLEPYDAVALVFGDNIKAILNTGAAIMGKFYGANDIEEIKNG